MDQKKQVFILVGLLGVLVILIFVLVLPHLRGGEGEAPTPPAAGSLGTSGAQPPGGLAGGGTQPAAPGTPGGRLPGGGTPVGGGLPGGGRLPGGGGMAGGGTMAGGGAPGGGMAGGGMPGGMGSTGGAMAARPGGLGITPGVGGPAALGAPGAPRAQVPGAQAQAPAVPRLPGRGDPFGPITTSAAPPPPPRVPLSPPSTFLAQLQEPSFTNLPPTEAASIIIEGRGALRGAQREREQKSLEPVEDPSKRMAGILIGSHVNAILEVAPGQQEVVRPGDDSQLSDVKVLRIERDRLFIEGADGQVRYVRLRPAERVPGR